MSSIFWILFSGIMLPFLALFLLKFLSATGTNLDPLQAEQLKKEEGEAGGDSPVSRALNSPLKDLVKELRLSFDYYESQALERTTNKIFFSGGSARLKNLNKFLAESLGLPTELWGSLDGLGVSSSIDKKELTDVFPWLSVGIGLALRGLDL